MAFLLKPTISLQFTFRDNDGARSTTEILLPGTTTAAAALAFAVAIRPLLANMSNAVITGLNVIIGYGEDSIGVIPSSDVEDKGVVLFNAANGIKSSIAIPSIQENALQGNNADIDQSVSAVDAFLTAMTAGISGTQPVNASGADLVSIKEAYKQNRISHKSRGVRKG